MKQILHSDWLGPAFRHTIYPLFTKLFQSRWMNVAHTLFQPRLQGTFPGDEVGFLCVFRLTETKRTWPISSHLDIKFGQ